MALNLPNSSGRFNHLESISGDFETGSTTTTKWLFELHARAAKFCVFESGISRVPTNAENRLLSVTHDLTARWRHSARALKIAFFHIIHKLGQRPYAMLKAPVPSITVVKQH
jgi:hypothetical protein